MRDLSLREIKEILPHRVEIDEFRKADSKTHSLFQGKLKYIPEDILDRTVLEVFPVELLELKVVVLEEGK